VLRGIAHKRAPSLGKRQGSGCAEGYQLRAARIAEIAVFCSGRASLPSEETIAGRAARSIGVEVPGRRVCNLGRLADGVVRRAGTIGPRRGRGGVNSAWRHKEAADPV
jgi:hypothetical protein